MSAIRVLTGIHLISFFAPVLSGVESLSFQMALNNSISTQTTGNKTVIKTNDENLEGQKENTSTFQDDEVGWTNINEEVDMVIPMMLDHLVKLDIEHLRLPDIKENISIRPLLLTYEAGILLSNGIVYNLDGIHRLGNAYMTYKDKSFLIQFYLVIEALEFEYNLMLKLMALEAYGKVIGTLDRTAISARMLLNLTNYQFQFTDFRITEFKNIHVQLEQTRLIQEISGAILSPITNLFRDRITSSISDGLKDQMDEVLQDFNIRDPLEVERFAKKILGSLTGLSS